MRNADDNFITFCRFYRKADYNNAAGVLFNDITNLVQNEMQLSPLVKIDLSSMLERLAEKHMPVPTPDSYHQTIDRAVQFLLSNRESDMRQNLN